MTFAVFLTDRAKSDLRKFSEKSHRQIIADINQLQARPFPDGKRVKKLKGFTQELYRLRAGDFRVVFQREGKSILIARILAKKDFKKVYG